MTARLGLGPRTARRRCSQMTPASLRPIRPAICFHVRCSSSRSRRTSSAARAVAGFTGLSTTSPATRRLSTSSASRKSRADALGDLHAQAAVVRWVHLDVELLVASRRSEDRRQQVDRVVDRLRRQPHRTAVGVPERDTGLCGGLDPAHLVDLALLEIVYHAIRQLGQSIGMERRQQVASEQVVVVLERLGHDLACPHVEPPARPDVERWVSLFEGELFGRLAVDPSLDLCDHPPALRLGQDGRPPLAGAAEPS